MDKKILYFSDLEGTILREVDGEFEDMEFYNLVDELTKLGNLINAKVEMRLISPIGFKRMSNIIDRMDKIIARHSKLTDQKQIVNLEEAAASSYDVFNDIYAHRAISKKLIELPNSIREESDPAKGAKRRYVDLVCQSHPKQENIVMAIYAGNGRNDIEAMKYIKSKRNGIVICPKNSRTEIKQMAHFVSENTDIRGITECIGKINKKIKEKTIQNAETDKEQDKILQRGGI